MPPRKSTASSAAVPTSPITAAADGDVSMLSTTTAAAEPKSPTAKKSGSKQQDDSSVGIEDLTLQRAAINRLARGVLPPNTSLQKDALHAIAKSATVFISYLASHANEQRPSAKTITTGDVLNALREIELDKIMDVGKLDAEGKNVGRLEREMVVFEEMIKDKRGRYRDKVKARESVTGTGGGDGDGEGGMEGVERGEPEAKRVRRSSVGEGDDEEQQRDREADREEEDALLDAQLNGAADSEEEVEVVESTDEENGAGGEEEGEEDEADEQEVVEDEEEEEDRIDVDDDPPSGRRVSSRSNKGRHSMLSPDASSGEDSD